MRFISNKEFQQMNIIIINVKGKTLSRLERASRVRIQTKIQIFRRKCKARGDYAELNDF